MDVVAEYWQDWLTTLVLGPLIVWAAWKTGYYKHTRGYAYWRLLAWLTRLVVPRQWIDRGDRDRRTNDSKEHQS